MLKLAHITTAYQSVVTILDSKLCALDKFDDLDVTVISSPAKVDDSRNPVVKYIPVEMARTIKPLADLKSIWQLYKILKRDKFDIVHSHTAKAGFITAIAAKMAKVPLICHTYHGLPFFDGQNRKACHLYRFFEKLACKFRDYIFTQNKRDLPECIKLIGSTERVLFEGNGVDIEFVKRSAKRQWDQATKEYPGEGLRLALLSRLEPVKRIEDFFKVITKLRQDGLKVSCVIAGTGFLEGELKNRLVEMRLSDCINMVGFSDHPHSLIAASDIVVLCSEKEGIPRVLMEAMALQKPVVATDVLGTQELVSNGETGFLVPLGYIGTIASKIKLLAEDVSLRKKMGNCSLERVTHNFNDIKISNFLHQFYTSISSIANGS
ncbi:MAG: glycosyltransferase family 4 protein [Planctomycetota bacterium]